MCHLPLSFFYFWGKLRHLHSMKYRLQMEMSLFLCPSFVRINLHYLSLSHSETTMPSNVVWFCTSRTSPQKMNLMYAVTSAGKQMECDKKKKMPVLPHSQWKQDKTAMPVNEATRRVNVEDSSNNWELQWDYLKSILWRVTNVLKKMGRIFKIKTRKGINFSL